MGYRKVGYLEQCFYIIKGAIQMKWERFMKKLKGGGSDEQQKQ